MKQLWDQQPKESSKAFAVFVSYRDMGLRRSFARVATELKKNPSSIAELSKRHCWQERVMAWDAYVDKESQQSQIDQVKAMKARQIDLAIKAQKAAAKGIRKLIQHFNNSRISASALRPDALAKLLDGGCRIERLNRDEPEQNMELLHGSNFDGLSEDEMQQFRHLLSKAEAR